MIPYAFRDDVPLIAIDEPPQARALLFCCRRIEITVNRFETLSAPLWLSSTAQECVFGKATEYF